ncbi:NitT/TauT family transport system permease protein [Lentzea xinjiangensis]|uniref:NitT/TauT family transport system permease protein n=1 Tax=Lentzea xinjiangensis TaxID=402600 RepID=A0A1H9JMY5_9PSEU|nr:ABC transporter permease [Lentzea xinjiangensis]SEQ88186.1 NitT/TauT family transport system permease protein [Lentzea xinjiangensis]
MKAVLPVLGLLAIVGAWWLATIVFRVDPFLLPSPGDVAGSFLELPGYLLEQTLVTSWEAVAGFALSVVIGVPIALLVVGSTVLERMFYPLLVALNAVPKIAVAPLVVVWFGFGIGSKVLMVVLVCIFPIVISTASGMRSTPNELVELFRSLAASRAHEFFKLRLWHALPQIFVGLKVSITLAVVGAVIGEFVGARAGLGYVISTSGASADTSLAFAAMALLAVVSVVLFYALVLLERKLVPWAEERRVV